MGFREYSNWGIRQSDTAEQIDPRKKYFIICEGVNTEQYYFKRLINNRKALGICNMIDLRLLEKDEDENGTSYPMHLIQKAQELIDNETIEYDKALDRIIVVFDADIFEYKSDQYDAVLKSGEDHGFIMAVTNPRFELFLLLHYENTYSQIIVPNEEEILLEENLHKNGLINRLLNEKSGINAKKNPAIGDLADEVKTAIEQEKLINQDIKNCKHIITSNIGLVIESIINDSLNN